MWTVSGVRCVLAWIRSYIDVNIFVHIATLHGFQGEYGAQKEDKQKVRHELKKNTSLII